jgi:hypothetical protein
MSEYQYFEFQTIDSSLTPEQIEELRSFSSRATITKNSFVNEYHWGDFKGDSDEWMRYYFDAFLYHANWGTHQLKLKLSEDLVDFKLVESYCSNYGLEIENHNGELILSFSSEDESGGWEEDWQLSTFLPLRTQLARGDYRSLYIGWLLSVQNEEYGDEVLEPAVPSGLGQLNEELTALVDFLRVDTDLLEAAALQSPPLEDVPLNRTSAEKWLSTLANEDKEKFLLNCLMEGLRGDFSSTNKFIQTFCKAQINSFEKKSYPQLRKVEELLKMAEQGAKERCRKEAERAALERAEKEKRLKQQRERLLDSLEGKEPALWKEVEFLVEQKQAASYKKAIELLLNLRDLAARDKKVDFTSRLRAVRERNKRKYSFIQSMDKAALV